MDPFIAEIRIFAGSIEPSGWAFCDGRLLSILHNSALFSLLGTTYGGDGTTSFALPNFQGMVPVGVGQGAGLTDRFLGETGGVETVTISSEEMPSHNHGFQVVADLANSSGVPGTQSSLGIANIATYNSSADGVVMSPYALTSMGSSISHNNMQPFLTLNFIIALEGIFPPRG